MRERLNSVIDAHDAARRVKNALVRIRRKAARSASEIHRDDLDEVLGEEQAIVDVEVERLLELAVGAQAVA